MSKSCQIAIYFGVHEMRGLRAAASVLVARYAREYRLYGYNPGLERVPAICQRWRLGDFYYALCVGGGD